MGNGHCASLFKIVIHMYIFLQTSSTVGLFVSSGRVPYTIFAVVSELFGAVYREAAPGFSTGQEVELVVIENGQYLFTHDNSCIDSLHISSSNKYDFEYLFDAC